MRFLRGLLSVCRIHQADTVWRLLQRAWWEQSERRLLTGCVLAYSETTLSSYDPIQIDAAIGRRDTRPGCAMGIESFVVYIESIRLTIRIHLHTRQ